MTADENNTFNGDSGRVINWLGMRSFILLHHKCPELRFGDTLFYAHVVELWSANHLPVTGR